MKLGQGESSDMRMAEPQTQLAAVLDERRRLAVLERYRLDELEGDPELAAITAFAAKLCDAPISLVSLVELERQRFLVSEGLDASETPRSQSFCAHAMLLQDALIIEDTRLDARFVENELVTGDPNIRFYAGQPLISEEGVPLGALCVIDHEARPGGLTDFQRQGLEVLAASVMLRLRTKRQSLAALEEQEEANARNRFFADAIPALAFTAEPDGTFEYVNQRWREYAGWADSVLPMDGFPNIHPEDRSGVGKVWREAIASASPFDEEFRYRRHDGEYRWMLARALPVTDSGGAIIRWFGTLTDIHDTHTESDGRDLLAKELSHRIKNIFAVVSSLIALRARGKPEVRDFADELTGTIGALGRAHDYVRPLEGRKGDSLLGLLEDLLTPYRNGSDERIAVSGDDRPIGPRAATPMALVFHELATNSAKYGALSTSHGTVSIAIQPDVDNDSLQIIWRETAGDEPPEENVAGFGSRLVKAAVEGQLEGSLERHFGDDGMRVELTVSTTAIAS